MKGANPSIKDFSNLQQTVVYYRTEAPDNDYFCGNKAIEAVLILPILCAKKVVAVFEFFFQDKYLCDKQVLSTFSILSQKLSSAMELKAEFLKQEKLAYFDFLTKSPNRAYFYSALGKAINRADHLKNKFSLFLLDIDKFKSINDTYGHEAGDNILIHVSKSINEILRENDFIARLGGDEFAILCEDLKNINDYEYTAKRISEAANSSLYLDNTAISVTVSMGIALYPINGKSINALLKKADIALYQAKKSGRNNFQLIDANK